ncbi:MAG: glycosyltransferase [Prevotella sp.]|nr:glycosyltransferase [Prevotella sp.]
MTKEACRFSVIMAVCDNAQELEENLPTFLTQTYEPGYEVIVVDESSTDNTEDVLKLFRHDNPHLYNTFLPKPDRNIMRRKLALTIGVKAAKNEWVILTDIHKQPPSGEWLKEISECMDSSTEAMIGYYRKKGTKIQLFDDITQARRLIRKAERKRADGHKGKHLKYLRGKYDFIVVKTNKAHDLLKYFEQKIGFRRLMGLRLAVMCQNSN